MSKEYLEALDWLEEKCYVESPQAEKFEECCKIIRQALYRLEAIDNAEPSEALKTVEFLLSVIRVKDIIEPEFFWKYINTIKQALIKAEKEHKALEIIKEKLVDVCELKICIDEYEDSLYQYNKRTIEKFRLTEEEFELLRSVLE